MEVIQFNQIILFAVIVMLAYFVEGLIGFGSTIMAIPIASKIIGIKLTIPVLTIIVLLASLFIAIRDFKYIAKKQFLKITSIMLLGVPIGMWLFSTVDEKPLKIALGIFMIVIAIKGAYDETEKRKAYLATKENTPQSPIVKVLETIVIFLGGIIHGAFTCGGPFIVFYATKNIKNKFSFRATLCALWATLNSIMLAINISKGEITGEIVKISFITMIFVLIAIFVSNIVMKKLSGNSFNKFVNLALFVSGILMIITS